MNGILDKSVEQILPDKKRLEKLISSKKIKVYLGVDPTGPQLHLGHSIGLSKLQEFADLGHEAILLFGTGTVLAGDPSQRSKARKKITNKEIEENIKTWKSQAEKIINFDKVKVKYNGNWLLKLDLANIIDIASCLSATQLIKRDMFQERLKHGNTVWLHEVLYPMLQGYDSVAMDIDLEIGGTDQTFNMLIGRELQKKLKGREKFVLTVPLMSGTDGKPMSKSSGNCIWLDDSSNDMFGKIMSMADNKIDEYWLNLTNLSGSKLKSLKPFEAKKKLAYEITKRFFDKEKADQSQKDFESVHQNRQMPQTLPTITATPDESIATSMVTNELVGSMTEAKNLGNQGGISKGSPGKNTFSPVPDPRIVPENDYILKIGTASYYYVKKKK